jgi:hypothetical protein
MKTRRKRKWGVRNKPPKASKSSLRKLERDSNPQTKKNKRLRRRRLKTKMPKKI